MLRCNAVSCCVNDLLKWLMPVPTGTSIRILVAHVPSRRVTLAAQAAASDCHLSNSRIQGLPILVILNFFVIHIQYTIAQQLPLAVECHYPSSKAKRKAPSAQAT